MFPASAVLSRKTSEASELQASPNAVSTESFSATFIDIKCYLAPERQATLRHKRVHTTGISPPLVGGLCKKQGGWPIAGKLLVGSPHARMNQSMNEQMNK